MMTTAITRRSSAPGPVPTASGIMPATNVSVVIKIGRRRSRLPWRMAASRSIPSARSVFMWSIWRIAFFLTTPKSTRIPSAE